MPSPTKGVHRLCPRPLRRFVCRCLDTTLSLVAMNCSHEALLAIGRMAALAVTR
jgi:hypothetical protein